MQYGNNKQQHSERVTIYRAEIYIYIENQMAMTFTSSSISTSYGIRWQWIRVLPNDSQSRAVSFMTTWHVGSIPTFVKMHIQHKCSKHKDYFPSCGNTCVSCSETDTRCDGEGQLKCQYLASRSTNILMCLLGSFCQKPTFPYFAPINEPIPGKCVNPKNAWKV